MKYRLKSDHNVTCEVQNLVLRGDWEPVPGERPVNDMPAVSIEEEATKVAVDSGCDVAFVQRSDKASLEEKPDRTRSEILLDPKELHKTADRYLKHTGPGEHEIRQLAWLLEVAARKIAECQAKASVPDEKISVDAKSPQDTLKEVIDRCLDSDCKSPKDRFNVVEESKHIEDEVDAYANDERPNHRFSPDFQAFLRRVSAEIRRLKAGRDHFLKKVQHFEQRISDCHKKLDEVAPGLTSENLEVRIGRVVERLKERPAVVATRGMYKDRLIYLESKGKNDEAMATEFFENLPMPWAMDRPRKLKLRIASEGFTYFGYKVNPVIEAEVIE